MPSLVAIFVPLAWCDAIAARRYHRECARALDVLDQCIRIVSFIGNHSARLIHHFEQFRGLRDIRLFGSREG